MPLRWLLSTCRYDPCAEWADEYAPWYNAWIGYSLMAIGTITASFLAGSTQLADDRLWGSRNPGRWVVAGGQTFCVSYGQLQACIGVHSIFRVAYTILCISAIVDFDMLRDPAKKLLAWWELWAGCLLLSSVPYGLLYFTLERHNKNAQEEVNCECCYGRWMPRMFGEWWEPMQNFTVPVCSLLGWMASLCVEAQFFLLMYAYNKDDDHSTNDVNVPWLDDHFQSIQLVSFVVFPLWAGRLACMIENLTADGGWHSDQLRMTTIGLQRVASCFSVISMIRWIRPAWYVYWWVVRVNIVRFAYGDIDDANLREHIMGNHTNALMGYTTIEGAFGAMEHQVLVIEFWVTEVISGLLLVGLFLYSAVIEAYNVKRALVDNAERNLELTLTNEGRTEVPLMVYYWPRMRFIRILDVSNNCINKISSRIQRLDWLTHLYLQHNELKQVPSEIGYLERLVTLRLDHNHLSRLPAACRYLTAVKKLNLSNNEFEELPQSLLWMKSLVKLNVSHNQIMKLHDNIQVLDELNVLDCSYNKLVDIPAEFFTCPNLEHLNVSFNELKDLPVSLLRDSKVLDLNAFGNDLVISELPGFKDLHQRSMDGRLDRLASRAKGVMTPAEHAALQGEVKYKLTLADVLVKPPPSKYV